MDKIYIIEDIFSEKEYKPNFTLPDSSNQLIKTENNSISTTAGVISGVLSAASIVSLPTALILNAAIASPSIYKALTNKKSDDTRLNETEVKEIEKFLDKNGLTVKECRARGFKFPPGHPIVGHAYRLHPLANYANTKKSDTYMPENDYDNILLEEREAELLKILINLGATKIEIIEKDENDNSSLIGASITADAGISAANISGFSKSSANNNNTNTRTYGLVGKRWFENDSLIRGDYAWLSYEPQWDTLITAREIGGCTSATVEIKQLSKYSIDRELSADIKAKIYEIKGEVKHTKENKANKIYIINVDFAAPLQKA